MVQKNTKKLRRMRQNMSGNYIKTIKLFLNYLKIQNVDFHATKYKNKDAR